MILSAIVIGACCLALASVVGLLAFIPGSPTMYAMSRLKTG